jgi:hypothetical protein
VTGPNAPGNDAPIDRPSEDTMSITPLREALPDLVARLSGLDVEPTSVILAGFALAVLYLWSLAVYRCKAAHCEWPDWQGRWLTRCKCIFHHWRTFPGLGWLVGYHRGHENALTR